MGESPAEAVRPRAEEESRFEPSDDLELFYKGAGGDADILSTDDEDEDDNNERLGDEEDLFRGEEGDELEHRAVEGGQVEGVSGGEDAEMQHYRAHNGRRAPQWRRRRFAQRRARRGLRKPDEPTKAEREEHELPHQPPSKIV